ncbi:MAG TPA: nucleotide disphospho-sugar-binding domain-containing protein [Tepidisphaeraceae bacterium]|nr:nucleotide disphospho-sugar-binding domain-containing protein [Tepidisphaeraceae bacterium]
MQVLLLTIGSAGDVHPFVGIGLALRQRGHRVKVLTNPHFQPLIERAGLEFVAVGTADDYDQVRTNPDLWHPRKGFHTVFNIIINGFRPAFDAVMNNYVPGQTVIAASSLGLAARCAQDKYNLPMATVHLQPAIFRSAIHPPKLPGMPIANWMPAGMKRFMFTVADRMVINPLVAPPLNRFRGELGLAPVRDPLKDWWHSPQRVIGLFPQWYAPPQADWPPQTRLTGFPRYDEGGISDMPAELAEFLTAGDPPIVFTPGSAMHHGEDFFRESVAACVQLNRRGVLMSRHADHIPSNLPANVRHFAYAPFSQLLPKAAVCVHHGGIGTAAQAMAAGVKQIVMPLAHDQFDNADRMQRLGIARSIPAKQYRAARVAKIVQELLADEAAAARCAEIARKFIGIEPLAQTCDLIEELPTARAAQGVGTSAALPA